MKKYFLIVLVLMFAVGVFFASVGCDTGNSSSPNPTPTSSGDGTGQLSCRVLDNTTNIGIPNVTVTGGGKTTYTNETGFASERFFPGTYTISFSKEGYITTTRSVTIVADDVTFLSVYLEKAQ